MYQFKDTHKFVESMKKSICYKSIYLPMVENKTIVSSDFLF